MAKLMINNESQVETVETVETGVESVESVKSVESVESVKSVESVESVNVIQESLIEPDQLNLEELIAIDSKEQEEPQAQPVEKEAEVVKADEEEQQENEENEKHEEKGVKVKLYKVAKLEMPSIKTEDGKPRGISALKKCIELSYMLNGEETVTIDGTCSPVENAIQLDSEVEYGFDDAIALLVKESLNAFHKKDVKAVIKNVETIEENGNNIKKVYVEYDGVPAKGSNEPVVHKGTVEYNLTELKGQNRLNLARIAKESFERDFVVDVTKSGKTKRIKLKPLHKEKVKQIWIEDEDGNTKLIQFGTFRTFTEVNKHFKVLNVMVKSGDYDRTIYSDGRIVSDKRDVFKRYILNRDFVKEATKGVIGKLSTKVWDLVNDEDRIVIDEDGGVLINSEVLLLTSTSSDFEKYSDEASEKVTIQVDGISKFLEDVKKEHPTLDDDRAVKKAVSEWSKALKSEIKGELRELAKKAKEGLLYTKKGKSKSKPKPEVANATANAQTTTTSESDELELGF